MPSLTELRAKWVGRRSEWEALGVQVDGARVAAEVLGDLQALTDEDTVTLTEASRIGGYSVDHLQRLVRGGTLANQGRKFSPRIRRADVPIKPGREAAGLPAAGLQDQFSTRRRIVADAQRRP